MTSMGVTSSLFTKGNIEGIKVPSRTAGTKPINVIILHVLFAFAQLLKEEAFHCELLSAIKYCTRLYVLNVMQ